jgi:hypothetical protein
MSNSAASRVGVGISGRRFLGPIARLHSIEENVSSTYLDPPAGHPEIGQHGDQSHVTEPQSTQIDREIAVRGDVKERSQTTLRHHSVPDEATRTVDSQLVRTARSKWSDPTCPRSSSSLYCFKPQGRRRNADLDSTPPLGVFDRRPPAPYQAPLRQSMVGERGVTLTLFVTVTRSDPAP